MSQTQRVLDLLDRLNSGETLCTKALSQNYPYDDKPTPNAIKLVQRDMEYIREFLGDNLTSTSRGCYRLINKDFLASLMPTDSDTKSFREFFEFLILFDDGILEHIATDKQSYIDKLKKETKSIYHIHTQPIEKPSTEYMSLLKKAIKHKQYISVKFDDTLLKHIQPHRIVFAEGNWYLATFEPNCELNDGFKFLRINRIKGVEIDSSSYHSNLDVESHILGFQSLFDNYKKPKYRVEILVSSQQAKYFRDKKWLKSQKILSDDSKGLLIEYQINNDMEILPLVKKWLPDIEIISPKKLRDRLYRDIDKFLSKRG